MVLPMLGQVALTLFAYAVTLRRRVGAVRSGEMDGLYFKTKQVGEPTRAVKQGDDLVLNLFEAPMLFFAGCITAIALDVVDGVLLGLASLFVLARIVHAHEYLGRNRIGKRFRPWTAALVSIALFWLWLTRLALI